MSTTIVIEDEIEAIEAELRGDRRFRKLSLLRELQALSTPDDERRVPALPSPVAKVKRNKKKQKAAPKKERGTAAAVENTDMVIDAIIALQAKKKPPTFAAIAKATKLRPFHVVTAVKQLVADKRMAPHGGRADRTYSIPSGKAEHVPSPPRDTASTKRLAREPVEDVVEDTAPPRPPAVPLPAGYSIEQFKRTQRDVMLGLLAAGDGSTAARIADFTATEADRVPSVLTQLAHAGLATPRANHWSFTELGYAAALAVNADEAE